MGMDYTLNFLSAHPLKIVQIKGILDNQISEDVTCTSQS